MVWNERPLGTGRIGDVVIDFAKIGDVFPEHHHEWGGDHVTVIASGGIRVVGTCGAAGHEFWAPSVIVWGDGSHGFIALAPDTRIVNVLKTNAPGYQESAPTERDGRD